MKKYLFIILGIALAIVSCKKDSDNNPQPIDTWVGSYDGSINVQGTIESEPISIISEPLVNTTLDNLSMTVTKLSSQRAVVTMKYGLVPIPFNAVINGNTANLDDYELIPTVTIPIPLGSMTFNVTGIKFSKIVLNYDNGVVTGSGNAVVTAESSLLGGLATINAVLELTPNFIKK